MFRKAARWIRSHLAPFPIDRPVFIIAPPRSGSTFLFEVLSKLDTVVSQSSESDEIWWDLFPYDRVYPPSDRVHPSEVDRSKQRALRIQKYRSAVRSQSHRDDDFYSWQHRLGIRPIRYLDKTIANCFRVDVLRQVFPEARFIFLVRDPRANVSSMIEGWAYPGRFGKPQLTYLVEEEQNATIDHWVYPAPPGWKSVLSWSLPKICAWSWKEHISWALKFFDKEPPEAIVRYEDLRSDPMAVIRRLAEIMKANTTPALRRHLKEMPDSQTTISSPERKKWKRKNEDEVMSILPIVRKVSQQIGYDV